MGNGKFGESFFVTECDLWASSMRYLMPSLNNQKLIDSGFIIFDLDTVSKKKIQNIIMDHFPQFFFGVSADCKTREKFTGYFDGIFDKAISITTIYYMIERRIQYNDRYRLNDLMLFKALKYGLSNKEIARQNNISESAVKYYLRHLYKKLGVSNRTQAAIVATKIDV
jgi:hypothetical protein